MTALRIATALAALTTPAATQTVPPYPPATCAALWQGFADRFGDDGEGALARRFRDWSAQEIGAAETDALIAEQRPWVRRLLAAYVRRDDEQSQDLFERMVEGCGEMEADLPPTP